MLTGIKASKTHGKATPFDSSSASMLTGIKASKTHGKATPNLNLLDVEESGQSR
jgi:hypothetical protein